MPVKGVIKPDHIPQNAFTLNVIGLIPLTVVNVSGFDVELESVVLPDRTTASGGNTKHVEFDLVVPAHHAEERAALDAWIQEGKFGLPTYKKIGVLAQYSVGGVVKSAWTLTGLYAVKGGGLSDGADMKNEGEMATAKYSLRADTCTSIVYK